jgi:hypothetical protein
MAYTGCVRGGTIFIFLVTKPKNATMLTRGYMSAKTYILHVTLGSVLKATIQNRDTKTHILRYSLLHLVEKRRFRD